MNQPSGNKVQGNENNNSHRSPANTSKQETKRDVLLGCDLNSRYTKVMKNNMEARMYAHTHTKMIQSHQHKEGQAGWEERRLPTVHAHTHTRTCAPAAAPPHSARIPRRGAAAGRPGPCRPPPARAPAPAAGAGAGAGPGAERRGPRPAAPATWAPSWSASWRPPPPPPPPPTPPGPAPLPAAPPSAGVRPAPPAQQMQKARDAGRKKNFREEST